MKITNLTPHPVTVVRPGGFRASYPACPPECLPRATEVTSSPLPLGALPSMPEDDTQGEYELSRTLAETGLVDAIGYGGTENLPAFHPTWPYGTDRCYIVSLPTAIGAVVAGRCIADLLVPMGQVRDADGRICGATGLARAESVIAPLVESIRKPLVNRIEEQSNAARLAAEMRAGTARFVNADNHKEIQ